MRKYLCVQVLAVDISIWLNQAVRGMRDKSGHAVPNAHLVFIMIKSLKLIFICFVPRLDSTTGFANCCSTKSSQSLCLTGSLHS